MLCLLALAVLAVGVALWLFLRALTIPKGETDE